MFILCPSFFWNVFSKFGFKFRKCFFFKNYIEGEENVDGNDDANGDGDDDDYDDDDDDVDAEVVVEVVLVHLMNVFHSALPDALFCLCTLNKEVKSVQALGWNCSWEENIEILDFLQKSHRCGNCWMDRYWY